MPQLLFSLLLCLSLCFAETISQDPQIQSGTLDNGLRYYLHEGDKEQGLGVSMLVRVGALDESAQEGGSAHFIEHLLYRCVPEAQMSSFIKLLRQRTLTLGVEVRATTNIYQTVYSFACPTQAESELEWTLGILHQIATQPLPQPETIEQERAIILNEIASYSNNIYAIRYILNLCFDSSRYVNLHPLGTTESISKLSREQLEAFYRKHYVPSNVSLVITGVKNAQQTKDLIEKSFADWQGEPAPKRERDEMLYLGEDFRVVRNHSEQCRLSVAVNRFEDAITGEVVTQRERLIEEELVLSMLKYRFAPYLSGAGTIYTELNLDRQDVYGTVSAFIFDSTFGANRYEDAIQTVLMELKRAEKYGFAASEIERASRYILSQYQQEASKAARMSPLELAMYLCDRLSTGRQLSSPAENLRLVQNCLRRVQENPRVLQASFARLWDFERAKIYLSGNVDASFDSEGLTQLSYLCYDLPVEPYKAQERRPFHCSGLGEAHEPSQKSEPNSQGVVQLDYENGVRAYLKPMPGEANKVKLIFSIEGGFLSFAPDDLPASLYSAYYQTGSIIGHSVEDTYAIFGGTNMLVEMNPALNSFDIVITVPREYIALAMQYASAQMLQWQYGHNNPRERFEPTRRQVLNQLGYEPALAMHNARSLYFYGDNRCSNISVEGLQREFPTQEQMHAYFDERIKQGPLCLRVVGDFDTEELLPILNSTVGAFPQRAKEWKKYSAEELALPMHAAAAPSRQLLYFAPDCDAGALLRSYHAGDGRDAKRVQTLKILQDYLQHELGEHLRLGDGSLYHLNVVFDSQSFYPNATSLSLLCISNPKVLSNYDKSISASMEQLCEQGPSLDAFKLAQQRVIAEAKAAASDLNNWQDYLFMLANQPEIAEEMQDSLRHLESISYEDFSALLREVLGQEPRLTLFGLPQPENK